MSLFIIVDFPFVVSFPQGPVKQQSFAAVVIYTATTTRNHSQFYNSAKQKAFYIATQKMITIIREIMIIQCGCSDMMQVEDGKLHSHLEWPNKM